VVDKEADAGFGTTKANSGLIHPGYAGDKGTLRLSLCKKGRDLFVENAQKLSIPLVHTSSILNVSSKEQIRDLEELLEKGRNYKVPGLKIIFNDDNRLRDIEPNISKNVIASLFCREHFTVSPYEAAIAVYENAKMNGIDFMFNSEVSSIDYNSSSKKFYLKIKRTILEKERNKKDLNMIIESDYVINAAGIFADEVSRMIGDDSFYITPIKGQYFLLDSEVKDLVRNQNIRMSDPQDARSKGMVVLKAPGGNFLIGSNYMTTDKYDISTTKEELDEIKEKLSAMIDNIPFDKVITVFAGLRAYADSGDFVLGPSQNNSRFINAAGIQSPGLTCSFLIAEMIIEHLKDSGVKLLKNRNFIQERQNWVKIDKSRYLDNNRLYDKNPGYGEIICRCEKVSEAEVVDAIRNGATTIDGIKFRTRAGMGRCQGGYCTLRIMKILSRELGIPYEQITKSGYDSRLAVARMD
jgi:glycerol-3-phosphate dehydrogenase